MDLVNVDVAINRPRLETTWLFLKIQSHLSFILPKESRVRRLYHSCAVETEL